VEKSALRHSAYATLDEEPAGFGGGSHQAPRLPPFLPKSLRLTVQQTHLLHRNMLRSMDAQNAYAAMHKVLPS
jgi:hypothetical protein